MARYFSRRAWRLLMPLLAACVKGSAVATGDLEVVSQGDASIEDGLSEADFADGWSVRFERFVVNVGGVALGTDPSNVMPLGLSPFVIVDHAVPGAKPVALANDVIAGAWPAFTYELRSIRATTSVGEGTTDEDLVRMRSMAASSLIKGVATKGSQQKTFEWVFSEDTAYDNCRVTDGSLIQRGVVVIADATTTIELPFSAKPLFQDDLAALRPNLRFEPIAKADANGDGAVSTAELNAVSVADVHANYGNYGTNGSTTIITLRDFIATQARRIGGFRSVLGSCQLRRL